MSRYDKQAIDKAAETTQPTFREFQAEIERSAQEAHKSRVAAKVGAIEVPPIERLVIDGGEREGEGDEDDDGRTLEDRLCTPTPSSNDAIAALLARTLQLHYGDVMLQLGPHNLSDKSLGSLLDHPEPSSTPPPSPYSTPILPKSNVDAILSTLVSIGKDIGAECSILHNPYDDSGRLKEVQGKVGTETESSSNEESVRWKWMGKALRVLLRRKPEGSYEINEVRVAVVGNVDAGKSSLLGVLTKGRLDDGRGRARVSLFRHKHEAESGRTSSVGMEIIGFTPLGLEILPEGSHSHQALSDITQGSTPRKQQLSWEDISSKASKIISFADLAGHERYLKTTLFGLTATSPDFVLLIVGANAGLIGMSKEHLAVALALNVPVVVVVTKIDMTPPNVLEQTVKQLVKVLKSPGCRKHPVFVKDIGMACELAQSFVSTKTCPIFLESSVTGEGLDLLKCFLNVVPTGMGGEDGKYSREEELEFSISDVFSVPFVGTVVSGVILSGKIAVGDTVLLGPDSLGAYVPTAIKSIQRKRVNVQHAEAGQSVSFALKRVKRAGVRKGMVLLAKTDVMPQAVRRFEGQVLILYHNTLIAPRYQAMLHVGSVRQTVQIESISDKACIRTGDRATVQFKFIKHSEHVKVGDRFLFREGRTRALGVVTKIL